MRLVYQARRKTLQLAGARNRMACFFTVPRNLLERDERRKRKMMLYERRRRGCKIPLILSPESATALRPICREQEYVNPHTGGGAVSSALLQWLL